MTGTDGPNGPDAPARSRGQTAQDFAIGIGLFLLTVSLTVVFLPNVLQPFHASTGESVGPQAERAAATLVEDFSSADGENTLNESRVASFFAAYDDDPDGLRRTLGLPNASQVNVTLQTLDGTVDGSLDAGDVVDVGGGTEARAGDVYRGREAGAVVRIVRVPGASGCDPGCRLVIRVW